MRWCFTFKTFYYISTIALLIFIYMCLIDLKYSGENPVTTKIENTDETIAKISEQLDKLQNKTKLINILQWTSPSTIPFVYMGEGQNGFIKRNCSFINCYVTANRSHLSDITNFDVIAFHGPEIVFKSTSEMPRIRSSHQKFAFVSIESSDYYPVCSNKFDNFFNWTWTFKVDSDARWFYLIIRDAKNNIIGPNVDMHWLKLTEMDPISSAFKEKIKTKTKAAAWFVSNCKSKSHREEFVAKLQEQLKKYKLSIDVYGKCSNLKCPLEKHDECIKMIGTDYYFYLSFENSFDEDYVTEKLLYPLQNNAIPIVFGAANYTRFMPDGIYLNARKLGVEKLAEKMNELISNPDLYAEYFRWKNHYSYHSLDESSETDAMCNFCSMLNDEVLMRKKSTYPNFRQWWHPSSC